MTTLAEFYSSVSAELRRGSSFDTLIPKRAQLAVSWMEKQHTFLHMEQFGSVSIASRIVAAPTGFKSMSWWRILKGDGKYRYLDKIEAKDTLLLDEGMPSGYIQNGKTEFWMDKTPDQTYSSERLYIGYSVLGTDTAASPTVIQLYESVIFHQTCVLMSTAMRDGAFGTAHKGLRDEAMKAAIDADVEDRQANENPSVIYGHEYREEINSLGDNQ